MAARDRLREISRILVGARRAATALPCFPGTLPENFADAYAIQQLSRESWPDEVAGWKVGGVPSDFIDIFGETHLVGPIFARSVKYVTNGACVAIPVFSGGFAAIEPELILQLGEKRAQDRLFIGAEIASSPLPAINEIGPIAVICDFGNNNGMIVGPEILDWRDQAVAPIVVECLINDETVGSRELGNFARAAEKTVEFLLSHGKEKGIEVTAGTYISTGAITGIHEAGPGASSSISFGRYGSFSVTLHTATAS
ncbi:hypothetical protein [Altererythrobacter aquiaggeris]|uniref:2-keto-4-pentenoate hydratase n=1 Tax=Aestuarierythrobacter aquiaggeris TaxID=1898396 RepID=UPI0030185D41